MLAVISLTAAAQEAPKFVARTELVLVPVIVRDHAGAHVAGLQRDDFTLLQDGQPQKVAVFEEIKAETTRVPRRANPPNVFSNIAPEVRQPRRVTILVLDLINTNFSDQVYAKQALLKYLSEAVTPDELLTLIALHRGGLRVIHDFTTDTAVLIAAIQRVRGGPGMMEGERTDLESAGRTGDMAELEAEVGSLSEAMEARAAAYQREVAVQTTLDAFETIARAYGGVPGRKALIWLTGSFPFAIPSPGDVVGSRFQEQHERLFHILNDANISVYPVDARGLVSLAPSAASRGSMNARNPIGDFSRQMSTHAASLDTMRSFADMTGGQAFYNTNDLAGAVRKADMDSSAYYMLGYYLDPKAAKAGWHKLAVKLARQGLQVHARSGFFTDPKVSSDDEALGKAEISSALSSPLDSTSLPLSARWLGVSASKDPKKKAVHFQLTMEPRTLTIDESAQNHMSLELVTVARNPGLKIVDQVGQRMEANLKPESAAKIRNIGLNYNGDLLLPPGQYSVRFVVRDNLSGRLGSVTAPIEVK